MQTNIIKWLNAATLAEPQTQYEYNAGFFSSNYIDAISCNLTHNPFGIREKQILILPISVRLTSRKLCAKAI